MQKTPIYKRCLWLLVALMMLALPVMALAEDYLVVKGGSLNLRQEASLTSAVLGQYPTGTWMTVVEKGTEWSKVKVAGKTGYVMSKYLSDTGASATMYVRTNTGKGLNMRNAPSLNGGIITSYAPGTKINVVLKGGGWYRVSTDAGIGYMDSRYLAGSSSSGTSTTGYPKDGYVKNPGAGQVLLLRETASTSARVLGAYGNGVYVKLLGESGNFYKVTVGGLNGYMMKKYIAVGSTSTPAPAPSFPEVPFQAKLATTNGGNVNFRWSANMSDEYIITSYPTGTEITVLRVDSAWSVVEINGEQGYIKNSYIKPI